MDIEFIWMLLEVSMLLLTLEVRIDDEVGKGNWKSRSWEDLNWKVLNEKDWSWKV